MRVVVVKSCRSTTQTPVKERSLPSAPVTQISDSRRDQLELAVAELLTHRGFSPTGARYFARIVVRGDGIQPAAMQAEQIFYDCLTAAEAELHDKSVMNQVWANLPK